MLAHPGQGGLNRDCNCGDLTVMLCGEYDSLRCLAVAQDPGVPKKLSFKTLAAAFRSRCVVFCQTVLSITRGNKY